MVFLDRTWNTVNDNTNVWRLRALCAKRSADGTAQRAYYDTGVGTLLGQKVRGGWWGVGINAGHTVQPPPTYGLDQPKSVVPSLRRLVLVGVPSDWSIPSATRNLRFA